MSTWPGWTWLCSTISLLLWPGWMLLSLGFPELCGAWGSGEGAARSGTAGEMQHECMTLGSARVPS